MPAMPKHPISGIPGSKPRVEPGPGSRRGELTDEYIAARNRGQLAEGRIGPKSPSLKERHLDFKAIGGEKRRVGPIK